MVAVDRTTLELGEGGSLLRDVSALSNNSARIAGGEAEVVKEGYKEGKLMS